MSIPGRDFQFPANEANKFIGWSASGKELVNVNLGTTIVPSGGDDAPAIQAAINSLNSNGGGVLHFGPYTYLMNSTQSTIPNVVLNNPCLKMEGMKNIILDGDGATITFGSAINDTAYLWLAIAGSAAAEAAGKFTSNITVKNFTVNKSRGATHTGTQGTINISQSDYVKVEDCTISGSGANYNDTLISGTNNSNVIILRNRFLKSWTVFDICNFANSTIEKNYLDPTTATDAVQGILHFWDPVTATYDFREVSLPKVQAHNLRILNNEIVGYKTGMAISSVDGLLIDGNTVRDSSWNIAGNVLGIWVNTDSDQNTAGYRTKSVQIVNNKTFNLRNAGAGAGRGIAISSAAGTISDVWIDGNQSYDNQTVGIFVEAGNTNINLGQNDFNSRDASGVQTTHVSDVNVGLGISLSGAATLADDIATSFTPPFTTGLIAFTVSGAITNNVIFQYNTFTGAVGAVFTGSAATIGTAALLGTTGTDVMVNYAAVSDGKIYVENRAGASRTIHWTIIGR